MATLSETKQRRANRAKTKVQAAKEALKEARKAEMLERQSNKDIDRQVAWMIGTTIRDLHKADKLTPQECATIGNILVRRDDRPEDWDLLAEYLPPPVVVEPVAEPDELRDIAAE